MAGSCLCQGAIANESARREFALRTIDAAATLDMEAYVHWDVDESLDPDSPARAEAAISLYNGSGVIKGAFMLGSVPVADQVGDVSVINQPALPWGFEDPQAAAATLNALPDGTVTYAYTNLKADPALVDAMAEHLDAQRVVLLGYRELLHVARMKAALR